MQNDAIMQAMPVMHMTRDYFEGTASLLTLLQLFYIAASKIGFM